MPLVKRRFKTFSRKHISKGFFKYLYFQGFMVPLHPTHVLTLFFTVEAYDISLKTFQDVFKKIYFKSFFKFLYFSISMLYQSSDIALLINFIDQDSFFTFKVTPKGIFKNTITRNGAHD